MACQNNSQFSNIIVRIDKCCFPKKLNIEILDMLWGVFLFLVG